MQLHDAHPEPPQPGTGVHTPFAEHTPFVPPLMLQGETEQLAPVHPSTHAHTPFELEQVPCVPQLTVTGYTHGFGGVAHVAPV